eukprot:3423469-Pleurochrysis_carterae.AAC.1
MHASVASSRLLGHVSGSGERRTTRQASHGEERSNAQRKKRRAARVTRQGGWIGRAELRRRAQMQDPHIRFIRESCTAPK